MELEYVALDGTGNVRATCFNVGMKKVEDGGFIVRGGELPHMLPAPCLESNCVKVKSTVVSATPSMKENSGFNRW